MNKNTRGGALTAVVLVVLLGAWAVFFGLGVKQDSEVYFTPTQLAAGEVYQLIPVWVGGTASTAQNGVFALKDETNTAFVQFDGPAPAAGSEVLVLGRVPRGRKPPCTPQSAECPFAAQTILARGSLLKYFYMGGYGFFVWVSYGLALIILLLNFILPRQREREALRSLARKLRRTQIP